LAAKMTAILPDFRSIQRQRPWAPLTALNRASVGRNPPPSPQSNFATVPPAQALVR
jgi:hypothetical protein